MRLVLGGFVLGVVILQQQAVLPGALAWSVGAALLVMAVVIAADISRRRPASHKVVPYVRLLAVLRVGACVVAALLVGCGYAAWRADLRLRCALPPEWEGRDIALTGHVRGLPARDATSVRFLLALDADEVRRAHGVAHFPRVVQLIWSRRDGGSPPRIVPGERWELTARLKRPHGHANFGARDTEAALFARGVRATGYVVAPARAWRLPGTDGGLSSTIDRWRLTLATRIEAALPDAAHRGIVMALAIGAQDAIDAADRVILRRTGTSHLVAISGLHIGFVAGLCATVAAWLWRRSCFIGAALARNGAREWPLVVPTPIVAAVAGTLCATCYAALAGFNVPAQRALWMLVVVSFAFALGRSVAPSLGLAWAAALVVLVDPWAVAAAGFWLSFGAVVVISWALHGRLRMRSVDDTPIDTEIDPFDEDNGFRGARPDTWRSKVRRRFRNAREQLAVGLRAQWAVTIGLAPLTAFWFSQISLAGPLANALAIPWVSLLVTPVVLVGIALPAPFDAALYGLAHALLEPLMGVLRRFSALPWAEWHVAKPSAWALACAGIGVAWCLMPRGWPLRFAAPLAWLPLALPPPAEPASGTFRLTALDIGQGSAILIETARHAMLFDAGPGPESTHAGERIVAPYLHANAVRQLDTLVVSHPDADHAGGAEAVLASVRVRQLLGGLPPDNVLWDAARAAGADTVRCTAGQRWRWDGIEFAVLWPPPGPLPAKSNARSCVLRVRADGLTALMTGDIDAAVERRLQSDAANAAMHRFNFASNVSNPTDRLAADVLIVAHHGSKTSSTEPFLDLVDPRVAIFQVGYRNRFGHPHRIVLSRFAERGVELARTDLEGAVRVELDGNGAFTLERYRDTHRRYWMDR
jgi:competence protein ComEC